jgi:predicted DsbA family dithiol-disulfide isomerase
MPLDAYFPPARIAPMHAHLQRFAADFGVTGMRFPDRLINTRRVLAEAEHARDAGRLDAFRHAAMEAHWREGRDLEDDAVLRALAARADLDPDAAVAAADDPAMLARVAAIREEATDIGVTGIPTFVIGRFMVVGCQPYEALADVATRAGIPRR